MTRVVGKGFPGAFGPSWAWKDHWVCGQSTEESVGKDSLIRRPIYESSNFTCVDDPVLGVHM